ncbi:MAG: peptidylprolyl isomerase [Chloroflexi bacterium]|nr:peptidylprolyl isomerase [Chloroflexota bacterium]
MAKSYSAPPEMTIDPAQKYQAVVKTNKGEITVRLFPEDAPKTVNNFVFLAREGYYDSVVFHRIIKGFMLQSGDPTGTGAGSPGYKFADEQPVVKDYTPGTLAMANAGPNTNGSQFFIMHGDSSGGRLPKNYTIFGRVIAGMDVVDTIASTPVGVSRSGERSAPQEEIKISSVEIIEG